MGVAIGGRSRGEAAESAHAIDATADALQARQEAQRRVTTDVTHELPTR
ncbi:MAG: hypothetical protein HOW59_17820 [Nonomuraea sp.]|nr:hypothetical protein [Nonomuraea sp.]